jgi:hypothetical protein
MCFFSGRLSRRRRIQQRSRCICHSRAVRRLAGYRQLFVECLAPPEVLLSSRDVVEMRMLGPSQIGR